MAKEDNRKVDQPSLKDTESLDGGPIDAYFNSDNAFSDKGLNNHLKTKEAMKKTKD